MLGGKFVGSFGIASCYSFYPSKNLGSCGEGGAVVTNNAKLAEHVRMSRNHGSLGKFGHDFPARRECVIRGSTWFDRGIHTLGHILDAHKDVQFEIQTTHFLVVGLCMKTCSKIIVIFVPELLQAIRADMVVRKDQTIFRDE